MASILWPLPARSQGVAPSGSLDFAIAPGKPILLHQAPQAYFTYTEPPGASLTDVVAVLNRSTTSAVTIRWSALDATTPPRGAGIALDDGAVQRQLGRWITFGHTSSAVAPNHVAFVPFRVVLPRSIRPGEYEGAISATSAQPEIVVQGRARYSVNLRRTLSVVLRVTGRATVGLQIVRVGITARGSRTVLGVMLRNTGTVIDHPIETLLAFSGPRKSYTLRAPLGAITGGASSTVAFQIGTILPAASYRAAITITYLAQLSSAASAVQRHTTWQGRVVITR